ncbi:MAG: chromosome partitioning protein [Nocardioides sp.]|nr:chromosome partitioning protein [Nocardioides sp.]
MRSRNPIEVVRRRWVWLVVGPVLGLLLAGAWAWSSTPTYRASASIFFSLQFGDSASALVQGSTYTQSQVTSYAQLATSPVVLQPVIDDLGLNLDARALAGRVSAAPPVDTVIVEVTVTDTSAVRSARIADAVVASLSDTVERLSPRDTTGQPTVQATTVSPAEVPGSASSPRLQFGLAVGLLLGLLAGTGLAWARELMDTRVRDAADLAELTSRPVIGTIDADRSGVERRVVVSVEPHGRQAEAFRQLRTNLQFLDVPGEGPDLRTIMVTSSVAAEGKSTLAANLAVALAETGERVLLVDADLRRPSLAGLLGLEGAVGLSNVLIGHVSVADVVQDWGSTGLQVITSGSVPPNPGDLLGSPSMARLLTELRTDYRYVVIDAAPLLPVADSAILAHAVDGTALVGNVTKVTRHQMVESLSILDRASARVLGVVLNQVRRPEDVYGYEALEGARASWGEQSSPDGDTAARSPELIGAKGSALRGAGESLAAVPVVQPEPDQLAESSARSVLTRDARWKQS